MTINPRGRVPALVTEEHGTITEAPAILFYLADLTKNHDFMPPIRTAERYEIMQWMAYLSSTIHPAFARLWRAERFTNDADTTDAIKQSAASFLEAEFAYIDHQVGNRK